MYQVKRESRSEFLSLRGWNYHLRVWGLPDPARPPLVLVHGWMDVAASWQFVVDALREDRWIVAPDWRGFGLTRPEGPPVDSYWFPDYLADLDALLDHVAGTRPVDLVGHSMGGHIATQYAGVRPQRVRRLVNLEGFGMPQSRASQAPGRLAQWLDEIAALRRGESDLKDYDSPQGVSRRLRKTNPRLDEHKADWLARQWAEPDGTGRWRIRGDAAHKVINPILFRVDETLEVLQRIEAPSLVVVASDDSLGQWWKGKYTLEEFHQRMDRVPHLERATVNDAGHMLHHDQPEALARLMEDFLAQA
ncbi:alpha/beta fold hydrolase [Hydrogenophaga sp.]|uniref:alpha/beta fold hydrolase n=1 Tax=Hydrogenophaga sp. TaxID=1904254 RepID=UPI0035B4E00D